MIAGHRLAGGVVLCLAFVVAPALLPAGAQPLPGLTPAAAPAQPSGPEDPLKRDSPRSAFLGFVSAAQAGNAVMASEYLQWPRTRLGITKDDAARQLMFVLNHGFEGKIDRLSTQPEGTLFDGFPPDLDRAGDVVLADGERVNVLLRRVTLEGGSQVWLIADATVADIPRLHDRSGLPEIEKRLPSILTNASFGGLPVWVPLALLVLLPVIYGLVRLVLGSLVWAVRRFVRRRGRAPTPWLWDTWRALSKPTAFLLTVAFHGEIGSRIGIPIYHRYLFNRTIEVLFIAGLVWWLWRLQDLLVSRFRAYLEAHNAGRSQSAYVMASRVLKGLTLGLAILIALALFGVDLSATLAGLGIGGLALAFAAQKTLENVFGGISVLGDRSIVVGDYCQIGKYTGTVEDVGMRTTKLRTLARTVVHVPNGALATMEVENFSRRDKFLMQTTLTLRYETTRDQFDRVLAGIRALLEGDARIDQPTQRVRFIRFAAYSLDIEVFAYLLVADYPAFLAVQEELLLRVMQIVADAGTGFAFPSQTLYLNRDASGPEGAPPPADPGGAVS